MTIDEVTGWAAIVCALAVLTLAAMPDVFQPSTVCRPSLPPEVTGPVVGTPAAGPFTFIVKH